VLDILGIIAQAQTWLNKAEQLGSMLAQDLKETAFPQTTAPLNPPLPPAAEPAKQESAKKTGVPLHAVEKPLVTATNPTPAAASLPPINHQNKPNEKALSKPLREAPSPIKAPAPEEPKPAHHPSQTQVEDAIDSLFAPPMIAKTMKWAHTMPLPIIEDFPEPPAGVKQSAPQDSSEEENQSLKVNRGGAARQLFGTNEEPTPTDEINIETNIDEFASQSASSSGDPWAEDTPLDSRPFTDLAPERKLPPPFHPKSQHASLDAASFINSVPDKKESHDTPDAAPAVPAEAKLQKKSPQDPPAAGDSPMPSSTSNTPTTARPGLRSSLLPIVGIDFGTSYSSISVMRAGLEVIPDEHGLLQMPTVISFPQPGEVLYGLEARKRMAGEAHFTIASPKRMLGRLYKDPQVTQIIGGLAFRTFSGSDKFVRFEAHGEIYSVPDICGMLLGKLRERACRYLNAEVRKAVFSVPVAFGTLQRSALEIAARQAGFEVVGFLAEPSAAVLSHGFRGQKGIVAVYDFGGGTFDFSVLEVSETAFQVLCAGGDPWLGGDDFDIAMGNYIANCFWKETGVDLHNRAVEWQALLFACEQAKRVLSTKTAAEVRLDDLLVTAKGSKGLRVKISRKDFAKLTMPLIEKSLSVVSQVISQVGITPEKVNAIVLTGGTSLIPAVREAVSKFFGVNPIEGDPDLAVVRGAALRAAELSGEAVAETSMGGRTLKEVAGRTIGAGPKGGPVITLFERDTSLPAETFKAFYTQVDGQQEMVIGIYEEAKSRVDESRTIGHLRYKGLHPAPAGQAKIDLTFYLDEDGILHVTAVVEGKEYNKSIRLE
jgi:molecular chaperone DnaK